MGLRTTCIGSYPKPDYVPINDWFQIDEGLTTTGGDVTRAYTRAMMASGGEAEALFVRATKEAIKDQVARGPEPHRPGTSDCSS